MIVYKCLEVYKAKTQKGEEVKVCVMEANNRKRCKLFASIKIDIYLNKEYELNIKDRWIVEAKLVMLDCKSVLQCYL
jgi:hypothetical protein